MSDVSQARSVDREDLPELIAAMPAGIYSCDKRGVVVYSNRLAAELRPREPALGDEGPDQRLEKEVLATGVPIVNREVSLERPDRSPLHVLMNIAPLPQINGGGSGTVTILQDITSLKMQNQQREDLVRELERSNHDLSLLAAAVSHDLLAPARRMRVLTQLLVRNDGGAASSNLAVLIQQEADGMQHLIESLVGYAHVGAGSLKLQRVCPEDLIKFVRSTLADAIAETDADVICQPLPQVEADPVQLKQVFQNVIANAIAYRQSNHPPVITIRGEPLEQGWQFTVTDNGEGIPPEYRESIFDPLKRLHTGRIPGSGLGLSICRRVITRHGGRIWVEPAGTGHGSSFCFTLWSESMPSPSEAN